MPRVLIVEDEPDIGALLEYVLSREGFEVDLVQNGRAAIERVRQFRPALVLLDRMLPDVEGLEVLRLLREGDGRGPRVIVVTARKDEEDRIRGLELGADDYVSKPFSPRELVLRVRAVLQREAEEPEAGGGVLSVGPIRIDPEAFEARVGGRLLDLTVTEFRLLAELVSACGRVRTREKLLFTVWGYDTEVMSRTVDTHVRRLRAKLGDSASWLGTVRGVGYRIQNPELG